MRSLPSSARVWSRCLLPLSGRGAGARALAPGTATLVFLGSLACFAPDLGVAGASAGAAGGAPMGAGGGRFATPGLAQVQVSVDKDSVRMGERLKVRYRFRHPDSLRIARFSRPPAGPYRLVDLQWSWNKGKEAEVETATAVVFTLDRERLLVPDFTVYLLSSAGDTFSVDVPEVDVPVRHVAAEGAEIKPLKEQWMPPPSYRWLYLLASALALVALALFLLSRRRRKPALEPARPSLPPDFVALKELGRIEKMGLPERGEFKAFYTLVVDVLRRYLEARFGIEAMDKTSSEIMAQLREEGSLPGGLEPLLAEADLVKFAKFVPEVAAAHRALASARKIVVATAPPPERIEQAAAG